MMEIDSDGNENAAPRQRVAISNFTFVHRNAAAGNGAAIRVRGGADYSFANGLIVSDMACLRIDSATTVQTSGPDEQGPPKFYSLALKCGASPFRGSHGVTDAAVQTIFEAGTKNSEASTPTLPGERQGPRMHSRPLCASSMPSSACKKYK